MVFYVQANLHTSPHRKFDQELNSPTKSINMAPRSAAELDALAVMDPEIEAIAKSGKIPQPELDYSNDLKAAQGMRALMEAWVKTSDREGVDSSVSSYEARDGHKNKLLVFRPSSAGSEVKLPVIVHIHGGGGCVGSPEGTASFCQELVLKQNCVVVAPQYRLAPENKYPHANNDCVDAVKHVANVATDIGGDLSAGFVIGGHSFGASAAANISLNAKDLGISAKITGLYLGAGAFIGNTIPAGYESQYRAKTDDRCINAPILDDANAKLFARAYSGDLDSPSFRACNVKSAEAYKGQPRAYFQVCGMEIYRDDGLILEDILRTNGAETRLDIYPGCPHIFWSVFAPGMVTQATKWAQDTQKGFEWLLRNDSTSSRI